MAYVDDQPMLTTLPNELLATIAENLDRSDLLSLRLVNREITAAIDTSFITRFFSRRTHLYTQHGLQALLDITSIPRLAAKIYAVQLVVVALHGHFDRGGLPPTPHHYLPVIEHFDLFGEGHMHGIETTVPTKEKHEDHERWREASRQHSQAVDAAWKIWTEQRQGLYCEATDVDLLSKAFRNLGSGNRTVSVGIFDGLQGQVHKEASGKHINVGTYGVRHLRELLGPVVTQEVLIANPCDDEARSVLSALSQSKLRVEEIDFCSGSWEAGIGPAAFNVNDTVFDDLLVCFAQLTTLKIGFSDYSGDWVGVSNQNGRFLAVMRAAVSLQILGIHSPNYYEPEHGWRAENLFSLVADAVTSKQLRSVTVSNVGLRVQQIVRFLQAHGGTLKALELSYLSIPDFECWAPVVKYILQELDLDTLRLSHLQRGDLETGRTLVGLPPSRDRGEGIADHLWLGRKQEVKTGLRIFWETAEYGRDDW